MHHLSIATFAWTTSPAGYWIGRAGEGDAPQAPVPLGVRLLGALLLNEGGSAVCLPPNDLDRTAILSQGQVWRTPPIPVRRVRGLPSRCHTNVAWLYEEAQRPMEIATGYGLSDDGMSVTAGVKAPRLVEQSTGPY